MLITDITQQASLEMLARAWLARLACEHDGQPYIIPISFAYDQNYLYAMSTHGQKITWMRSNPRVCVEVEELVSRQEWITVIVAGRYEELADVPDNDMPRKHAYDVLRKNALWWEPGYVKTVLRGVERPLDQTIYFRIHIDQIHGHRGVPDPAASHRPSVTSYTPDWLKKLLGRPAHHRG